MQSIDENILECQIKLNNALLCTCSSYVCTSMHTYISMYVLYVYLFIAHKQMIKIKQRKPKTCTIFVCMWRETTLVIRQLSRKIYICICTCAHTHVHTYIIIWKCTSLYSKRNKAKKMVCTASCGIVMTTTYTYVKKHGMRIFV